MASRVYAKNLDKINPIQRDMVNRICKYLVLSESKHIARKVVVFGSSTTNKATVVSDVDIAVDFVNPETYTEADGTKRYERPENNSFVSWANLVTQPNGMSLVDIEELRTFPKQFCDGIPEAVASGVVVFESEVTEDGV